MTDFIKSWNKKTIRIRADRYVSLTDMAQATGKNAGDFLRLDKTTSYLNTLSVKTGFPVMAQNQGFSALVEVKKGGDVSRSGTWGHPKVAIRFAQWCSDDFAIQVDSWIDELLTTGKVDLVNSEPKKAIAHYSDRVMKLKEQLKFVPEDHWVVMQHCGHVLLEIERLGYAVGAYDLADGSIGAHWGRYRKTVGLTATPMVGKYKVNQAKFPVSPNAYHLDELKVFVKWLEKTYILEHLPTYLQDRPKAIIKAD